MNESTLVPREEMSDLDWLARNVHVWREGANYICVDHTDGGYVFHEHNRNCAVWFTRDQWLARRAELQSKPSWGDAPEWAEWIAQHASGFWCWGNATPECQYSGGVGIWDSVLVDGKNHTEEKRCVWSCIAGEVLGDWRDTLEKRPKSDEAKSDYTPIGRIEGSEYVLYDPFVSVEDAATAKQQAPKGSGNPILGMVLADLTNRALEGKDKYGEPLLAHNGRNPLWDAYQEALDLAMYLRQAIEEQNKC